MSEVTELVVEHVPGPELEERRNQRSACILCVVSQRLGWRGACVKYKIEGRCLDHKVIVSVSIMVELEFCPVGRVQVVAPARPTREEEGNRHVGTHISLRQT